MRARQAGYEKGFRARYNRALGRLEALGYVERDPSSPGHWRVTARGLADANENEVISGASRPDTNLAKKLLR